MKADEIHKMRSMEDWYWWFVANRRLVLSIVDGLLPATGAQPRLLDVGCGSGSLLSELKERGMAVGTDLSPEALAYCHENGERLLCRCDSMKLPFAEGSFDLAISAHMLEHIEDDRAALREMRRVVRSGGRLVIVVPAHMFLWGGHDVALDHKRRYRRRELLEKVTSAGLTIERLTYTNSLIFPVVLAVRLLRKGLGVERREETDLMRVPRSVNRALIRVYQGEIRWLRKMNLFMGVDLLCVARKL